jgi:SAM-dependent methyltransferase
MARVEQSIAAELRNLPEELELQAAPGVGEAAIAMLPSNGAVLVAGAGRGGLSLILSRRGYQITNVDLHPEHFKAPGLSCSFADLNCPLSFQPGSFDVVFSVEVLEHLESPWAFLREALRVLRPGGCIVFTTPNVASLPAKLAFLRNGQLPYFRIESFVGCYHVTPIFPWAVERWAKTESAMVDAVTYSRANWPTSTDLPRTYERPLVRALKKLLPVGSTFGEIACFRIIKTGAPGTVAIGQHYA